MAVAVETMSNATDEAAPAKPASQRVRDWVKQQKDGQAEVKAPELASLALKELGTDSEFLLSLGREMLRQMVYRIALETIAETRQSPPEPDMAPDAVQARVETLRKKFTEWMEHSGDAHRSLLTMNREQLMQAAAERRARANADLDIAAFLETLAKRLKGTQTVGDRFQPDQIEFIRQSMKRKKEAAA